MFPAIVALDTHLEIALDSSRSAYAIRFFEWMTHLGDARIITVVALSVAFVLWRHRRLAYKAGFAVALFGSLGSSYALKILIERARPPHSLALYNEPGYSFPSMHAAVSMAVYGFLAYAIWKLVHPPHHRAPAVALLCALILLIGYSRIYLGLHYTSDVIGGFIIGALFIWLGSIITVRLNRRHKKTP